jgi:hypothetical protein
VPVRCADLAAGVACNANQTVRHLGAVNVEELIKPALPFAKGTVGDCIIRRVIIPSLVTWF